MDKETFKKYVPTAKQHLVTDKFVDTVNSFSDPELRDTFRENLFRFSDLWTEFHNLSLPDLANAVLFCSYRLMGFTVFESWKRTFPDRYAGAMDRGIASHVIEQYAHAFHKRPICVRIMERSLVPIHILNADVHQEAINRQAELMRTARSENVRMKAAECLIVNLRPPSEATLNVNVSHNSEALDELRSVTRELALQQRQALLDKRADLKEVAEGDIIDVGSDKNEDVRVQ